ncbi:MAG TPA: GlsB/YeaQ/YmgE family stress response membrane protein [Solirubrobacterales bacterium]|nr:GlsB/YeaQ/YmgE family stress response membrane protein [Solirubrobacterales bacterium]
MGIIGWIVLGLLVGAIARALVPGRTEPSGCIGTTAIGVLGALIGGFIASALDIGHIGDFFDIGTWLIAIAGSVLLLLIVRAIAGPPSAPPR